jgi:hypothetical protein
LQIDRLGSVAPANLSICQFGNLEIYRMISIR